MPESLLELYSEEIPARMQAQAAKDLERLVVGALSDRGLMFEGVRAFSGPRRLTLAIAGLPAKQPDMTEERKGPRVDAPQKAIDGFLKSAGLTLDQCQKRDDPKGAYYLATIERKGRATEAVLAEILPEQIAKLPWPKSMRWGDGYRWVRPLHGIVATFDGEIVPFAFGGVHSGNETWGHRFLSRGSIVVRRFEDYEEKLKAAHVVVRAAERRETILHAARQQAFALGLELIEDEGLADEVTGLVEWPVVLIGTIDPAFLDVPGEILQTAMRAHQKYFALRDPATTTLANKFVLVANMAAEDGGKEIVAGNERVLRARLADAKFFWDQDRKRTLESRVEDLKGIVFHAKLGTQYERVERIVALSGEIAKAVGLKGEEIERAKRAGRLCKADLTSGVVGEFPELQGIMGRYYALNDDESEDIADAIRDHYRPLGPNDLVPAAPLSVAVALADKIDTLTGFFAIGEKPTGSGDPYALRRAALGVIRLVVDNNLRLQLDKLVKGFSNELLTFFIDRLKVALRERRVRYDLIDAVFGIRSDSDLLRLMHRVGAVQDFLKTNDGANLLAGYKRAANILRIEEKKDKKEYRGVPDGLRQKEERELQAALTRAKAEVAKALAAEDFAAAMAELAKLRVPVDRFFDNVTVNADDEKLRENRLKLLSQIVETAHHVADFSKVES